MDKSYRCYLHPDAKVLDVDMHGRKILVCTDERHVDTSRRYLIRTGLRFRDLFTRKMEGREIYGTTGMLEYAKKKGEDNPFLLSGPGNSTFYEETRKYERKAIDDALVKGVEKGLVKKETLDKFRSESSQKEESNGGPMVMEYIPREDCWEIEAKEIGVVETRPKRVTIVYRLPDGKLKHLVIRKSSFGKEEKHNGQGK